MSESDTLSPLGILAGSGDLPLHIARRAEEIGRPVFIVGLKDSASQEIETFPHSWISWVELDKLFKNLNKAGVEDLVIIGGVRRPKIKNIKIDFGLIKNIPFLLSLTMGGDDQILSSIIKFIEDKGFTIVGAHQIAPDLTASKGCLTRKSPSARDRKDMAIGIKTVLQLGTMDIGQGAVVARQYVLCVEAAEGTDQMLERAKGLRQWGAKWLGRRFGVLVKWPKPNQELRIDMPTIGPRTVELVEEAGLAGICIAPDKVLISQKQKTIDLANQKGIFIIAEDAAAL